MHTTLQCMQRRNVNRYNIIPRNKPMAKAKEFLDKEKEPLSHLQSLGCVYHRVQTLLPIQSILLCSTGLYFVVSLIYFLQHYHPAKTESYS
jgi:hypothetical protein